jgi:hypothetical protein
MLSDVIKIVNIDELLAFVGSVSHSHKFSAYLRQSQAKYRTIPTYTKTRWFSLWKTVRNCVSNREHIDAFIVQESKSGKSMVEIERDTWENAEKLMRVLGTFKNACLLLESDKFGSISHVFEAFRLVRQSLIGSDDVQLQQAWKEA